MKKSYVAVGVLLVVSMLALAPTIGAEVPSPVATEVRPVVVTNTASGPVPVQVMNPASAKVEPFQVQLQTAVTGAGGSSANFTTPRNLAVDYVSVSPFGDSLAVGPFGGVLHAEIITTTGGVTARFALPFEGNNPSYVGTAVQFHADAGSTVTVLALGFDTRATFTVSVAGRFE